jgi:hypothetical protein
MRDLIEDVGKESAWKLLEAEIVPQVRGRERLLFFQVLQENKEIFDMPQDNWRE